MTIANLLDIITIVVAFWAINKMSKALTGKTLRERLRERMTGEPIEVGIHETDYAALLAKFCKLTGMTQSEVFLLARTEKGFGHSDEKVRHHLSWYVKNGELPNYVESFLEDGRNFIYNA